MEQIFFSSFWWVRNIYRNRRCHDHNRESWHRSWDWDHRCGDVKSGPKRVSPALYSHDDGNPLDSSPMDYKDSCQPVTCLLSKLVTLPNSGCPNPEAATNDVHLRRYSRHRFDSHFRLFDSSTRPCLCERIRRRKILQRLFWRIKNLRFIALHFIFFDVAWLTINSFSAISIGIFHFLANLIFRRPKDFQFQY